MGRYEKKPTKHIDWLQTVVNGLVDLIVGLILAWVTHKLK